MRTHHHLTSLAAATLLAASAGAQSLPFTLAPGASSLDVAVSFELRLPGTLIGDHDPVANPTGTRTLPGLLGGTGNQPVSVQLDLIGTLDVDTLVGGGLTVRPDAAAGSATVEGLSVELPTGSGGSALLSLRLTYDTFRTFDPDSLFPSLIPIELPLGQASLGSLVVGQSAPVTAVLTPTGVAGELDLTALVPALLSFEFDFNGQATPVGPLPIALPLAARLDLAACEANLTGGAAAMVQETLPAPVPFELVDLPFPLPTVLPPGGTANLLLSVALDEIAVDASVDLALGAVAPSGARVERYCVASPNSTGAGSLLEAFGSTSLAANDLRLGVAGLPASSFGYFLMSGTEAFTPGTGGGQGTMCIADPCYRFTANVQLSGAGGAVNFQPDLTALPMGLHVHPGESWRFQYWYRDANPLPTSNLTDGLRVLFCE